MEVDKFKLVLDDLKKRKIPTEVKRVVTAMLDKKTEKIVVLKLKEVNAFTDYMVIGTGNSQRQNSAISDEVQKIQKNQ
ncbi:MAG: RsfS/YbeB/iojap family protein, partial [bacterium]|nr:RsfS/YbeB/iojap family protein [bacterium]